MSTQADKLNAKLDELAERATHGSAAMEEMVAKANATARLAPRDHPARLELEQAGRAVREAADRRMRSRS